MHKYPASGGRLIILDQASLTALLTAAIQDCCDGNLLDAARTVNIPQPQLWKITHGKLGSITWATWRLLRNLVPLNRRQEFGRCFLNAGAQGNLQKYETSLEERYGGMTDDVRLEFEQLRSHIRDTFETLLRPFDDFLRASAHDHRREEVAYWEMLKPLLESERSGGVERHWRELKPSELKAYLKAAIKCQSILLNRENPIERAQGEVVKWRHFWGLDPNNPSDLAPVGLALDRPPDLGTWPKL